MITCTHCGSTRPLTDDEHFVYGLTGIICLNLADSRRS